MSLTLKLDTQAKVDAPEPPARQDAFYALLVALIAGFATMPLWQPYFFASSDGLFHLYRFVEYDSLVRSGIVYPRWAPDFFFGQGLPFFNYYAPLTYVFAELFHLLGAGYLDALRLLAAAAMAASGIGAYLYARTLLSPVASLALAVFYMYAPYHIVNLYYRGDLAEYLAYAWFPFILWALNRFLTLHRFRYCFAGTLCYAGLILTHNLSAFIFAPFFALYALAAIWHQHKQGPNKGQMFADIARLASMGVASALLTAFFWLPAIGEKSLLQFDRLLLHYDFHEQFPSVDQLLSTSLFHRYGIVFRGAEVFGYKLGLLQAVFVVVGAGIFITCRTRFASRLRLEVVASLLVVAIALFLIFPPSTWLWENIPLLNLTQFPWRLLAFVALPIALFAGTLVDVLRSSWRRPLAATLCALVIASSVARLQPLMVDLRDADLSGRGATTFELTYGAIGTAAANEYLPTWVKSSGSTSASALSAALGEPIGPVAGRSGTQIEASIVGQQPQHITYRLHARQRGAFVPSVLFFPGWTATLDGSPVDIAADDPSGLIGVQIPQGEHTLELRFGDTPLRQTGNALSLLAFLAIVALLIRDLKRHRTGMQAAVPATPARNQRQLATKALVVLGVIGLLVAFKITFDIRAQAPATQGNPLLANFGDQVMIEGYDLRDTTSSPGALPELLLDRQSQLTVYWRPLTGSASLYHPMIRLTNRFGQSWAYAEAQPAEMSGGDVASTMTINLPQGTPPGIYELEINFADSAGQLLEVRRAQVLNMLPGESGVRIGPLVVARLKQPAAIQHSPPVTHFSDALDLTSVSVGTQTSASPPAAAPTGTPPADLRVAAGSLVHLDLLWHARRQIAQSLTVTARLVSGNDLLWSVRDSPPADGTYPTTFWRAGEVVHDQLSLKIAAETPPGEYELQMEVVAPDGPLSIIHGNGTPVGPTLRLGRVTVTPATQIAETKSVPIQHRHVAPLAGGLSVVGYSLGRPELKPGEQVKVELLWQSNQKISSDLTTKIALIDNAGKAFASCTQRPAGEAYPTTMWRPGEVFRAQCNLRLLGSAPEGSLDLVTQVFNAGDERPIATKVLDQLHVLPRTRSFSASPSHTLAKELGGKIRLLGFDIAAANGQIGGTEPAVTPGQPLVLTLYWQAITEMETSYKVFTQVLSPQGQLVAQHDGPPQSGQSETTSWQRDEVVADDHTINLPSSLPAGDYTVIAGLYDPVSGQRLTANDGTDFVKMQAIRIASSPNR